METLPYQPHSPTSRAAAVMAEPMAGTAKARVLEVIRRAFHAGMTDEEIQACGIVANTQRPRRVELVRAGLVRDSGRTRKTASGAESVVWVAV